MKSYVVILIILFWSANLASAADPKPDDPKYWSSAVSSTLYKGESLSNGDYMVKAVQFPSGVPGIKNINGNIVPETEVDPMVYLEIYKNGVLLKEIIMTPAGGAYIDPDNEVKISATDFLSRNAKEWVFEYYKPWANVGIQLRAKPKLEVTVTTLEKSIYTSNEDLIITARVTVKNSGDGYAKNVEANLDIGDLKLRGGDIGQLRQFYYELEAKASQSYDIILLVPNLIDEKSYSLSATAKGQDVKELSYNAAGSVSVTVSPKQNYFGITKAVRDRIYLQDTTIVVITISNGGMYDIRDIQVSDSMSEFFELRSPAAFQWNISLLKPGQEWSTQYSIRPLEANQGGFTIPAASATFTVNNKKYSASSNAITMIVNGPKIIMNKTVSKPVVNISEDVTVTVSINNAGNIGSRFEVKDSFPERTSLVSGMTSLENYSEPGTVMGFSYIIRMNSEGVFELPAAVANYTDIKYAGTTRAVKNSDRPVITVVDPSKVTPVPTPVETQKQDGNPSSTQEGNENDPKDTPEPTPPITPGFDIVLALIVLIFAAIRRR
ncbi:MAG: hypothetical protein OIN88_08145 [Candidatus Methanoperedens sp.]|nr:hypothetical protein [Candidatus Methanoperedens sp.]MCZ7360896.1 hypothetical protein [Candidatus Methanoperedens sp.]HLB69698.1 hypothetical protein [Candidatus Methanoperedens sp.]